MTSTVQWTPSQRGNSIGGVWGDAPAGFGSFLAIGGAQTVGLVFDATTAQNLNFATVGGQTRILDGPILTGFTLSFSLGILGGGSGATACTIEIGVVPEADAANYAFTTLIPFSRNEEILGSFALGLVPELPTILDVSLVFNTAQVTQIRSLVTSRSGWSGKLALSIRLTIGNALEIQEPSAHPITLDTTQEIFFNGLIGGPSGPRQRYVRDARFGMPALNTELIRDGDQPSLFVRTHDWDEEDPEQEYRPKSGEGTVDDGIPE